MTTDPLHGNAAGAAAEPGGAGELQGSEKGNESEPPAPTVPILTGGESSEQLPEMAMSREQATGMPKPGHRALLAAATRLEGAGYAILDLGGNGDCGPRHLAVPAKFFGYPLPADPAEAGMSVREMAMDALSDPRLQSSPMPLQGKSGETMTVGMAMVASLIASVEPHGGEDHRTVERYLQLMRREEVYFENMAIAGFCTRFKSRVEVMLLDPHGARALPDHSQGHHVINPLDGSVPEWIARLICVDNEHFALLVKIADAAETQRELLRGYDDAMESQQAARLQAKAACPRVQWVEPLVSCVRPVIVAECGENDGSADQVADMPIPHHARSHTFKTEAELDLYLASPASEGLRHLVAYEFSGALRCSLAKQLEPKGEQVMSVDRRATERPGLHFEGDVWVLVGKKQWACIWFVGPPCFQHLRFDDYLGRKIEDGRAYWAGMEVLKCICCPFADSVFVEQPDTIGHDYIDISMLEGTYVMAARTSQFGDDTDKFMRFTLRNLSIADPPLAQAPVRKKDGKRSQFLFADADERDRKRSSWSQHPRMCDHIATTVTFEVPPWPAPDFQAAKQRFAEAWRRAGHPVPADGLNPEGLPSTDEGREYQKVRGAGRWGSKGKVKILRSGRVAHGIKSGQVEGLDADTSAVVPVAFADGEPVAYVPSDPTQIGIVEEPANGGGKSLMAKAEHAVRSIACAVGSLFAYRAGVTADHAKLVVVAAEKPASEAPIVKDPEEREHKRGAGVYLPCGAPSLRSERAMP